MRAVISGGEAGTLPGVDISGVRGLFRPNQACFTIVDIPQMGGRARWTGARPPNFRTGRKSGFKICTPGAYPARQCRMPFGSEGVKVSIETTTSRPRHSSLLHERFVLRPEWRANSRENIRCLEKNSTQPCIDNRCGRGEIRSITRLGEIGGFWSFLTVSVRIAGEPVGGRKRSDRHHRPAL
jgi:hypothetical protein